MLLSFPLCLSLNGGSYYVQFAELLLCVDLRTPSGPVVGVIFVVGVDLVVLLL